MNNAALLLNIGLIFIITISVAFFAEIRGWRKTLSSYVFANRKIQLAEGAGAICVHWIWAPALFISPTIAYNYGWQGLLYFCVPNGISVMIAGYLVYRLREREESSLTNLIARDSPALATVLRLMFACVSFAALVLAFTATTTLLEFTNSFGLFNFDVKHVTAIAGLLAFVYTVLGGLRTSVFTGFLIFLCWIGLVFAIYTGAVNNLIGWYGATGMGELFNGEGAKEDGITNELFFASFGAAFLPLILVGASGHGMMWQKGMSMKREDILPAFILAGFMFMLIIFMYGLAALYTFLTVPGLANAETAGILGIHYLLGPLGAAVFITLFLWQTLTVMDSALNYLAYVVSEDILKAKSIKESKEIMYGVMGLFVLLAWFTANMGWKIWPLFMVMSAIRTSCFSTMYYTARGVAINHRAALIAILIAGTASTSMAIYNKFHTVPWLDFYAIMLALLLPWIVNIVDRAFQKTTDIFENWN